jgi:hypothetical protein
MKILITMLLLSAFIIVSCDGGTKKDTDKDLGISDTDVITDQEVTDQDSPVPDDGDVVDEENDLSDMDSDEDVDDEESDEESDEDPLLCEEGDTRIISCGFNDNGDQEQICADGVWKKQGDCDDPDECKYREERNCVDFESFERCVDGSWETISLEHEGLEWSCRSPNKMNWQESMDYYEDNGWRLPTISELRTLVQNCHATATGGDCKVTDDCLDSWDCRDSSCHGCPSDSSDPGKYSVFGDPGELWSSSVQPGSTSYAWCVDFGNGEVYNNYKTRNLYAVYVKDHCETEGETRIVSCGFNYNGEKEQICADGVWKKQGDCDDPDECKYREERNCVDFDSFQRCIEGSWETISLKHEGLEWSCRSPAMKWQKAMDYCENMAGRLPTISELRTLIQNCPATETGGSCGVTDSCLSYGDCWNGSCSGCVWDPGKYSVFWDGYIRLWSSSHVDSANFAWLVFFYYGDVVRSTKTSNDNARCVK